MEVNDINLLVNNKNFIKKVQYILIALFILVIVLDVYLALDSEDGNTISNVIQLKTDNGLLILTYFWGAIAANLFFIRFNKPIVSTMLGSIIIISIAFMFTVFNLKSIINNFITFQAYGVSINGVSMLFGFILGLFFGDNKNKNK